MNWELSFLWHHSAIKYTSNFMFMDIYYQRKMALNWELMGKWRWEMGIAWELGRESWSLLWQEDRIYGQAISYFIYTTASISFLGQLKCSSNWLIILTSHPYLLHQYPSPKKISVLSVITTYCDLLASFQLSTHMFHTNCNGELFIMRPLRDQKGLNFLSQLPIYILLMFQAWN